jgi:hypothetical protein
MRHRRFTWVLTAAVAVGCTDAGPSEPEADLAPLAAFYLDDALDVMELNSIRRYEIDWNAFRAQARADAIGAVTPSDVYPTIIAALERIGDNHSFFRGAGQAQLAPEMSSRSPGRAPFAGEGREFAVAEPTAGLVAPGVGYVDVPAFSGGGQDAEALAATYHRLIEGVDTLGQTCRWVVDLRGNTGGNMWPMVAGIGPVLGGDTLGFFVDPDTVVSPWIYEDGEARIAEVVITAVEPGYDLESPAPNVAVLTDSLTASSGEAVAVAFRGRPRARSFGGATWGVSTANAAFPLSDGAVIFLTVATMADRLGTLYGDALDPDEPVAGSKTGDPMTDAALGAALRWLAAQRCG